MKLWSRIATVVLLPLFLAACGDLFSVDNPTNIIEEELEDERMLDALGNTPEGAFSLGWGQLILDAALVVDEGTHHSTRTSRLELMEGTMGRWNEQYDDRYNEMARARWLGDNMLERLERLVQDPSSDLRMAHASYWGALSRVVLAENFEEVPIDGGPPQAPDAILEASLQGFDRAVQIATAGGDANLAAAALGSKARALRALYFERGNQLSYFQQAAQAAGQALSTAATYWLDVRYQQPGSSNSVFARAATGAMYDGMHPRYAFREDPVSGQRDPRIVHTETSLGLDPLGLPIYEPLKYASRNADIPASRWQEAELILAEYALITGALGDAVDHINNVRRNVGLPDFSSSDPDEIFAQLDYERSTEFWLEGRRWPDMRYWGMIPPDWIDANKQAGVDRRWPVSQQEIDTNEHYR